MPEAPIRLDGLPEVRVRRHPRSRGMKLRFDTSSGRFSVIAAPGLPRHQIQLFLLDNETWMAERATKEITRTPFELGRTIPIFDAPHEIARSHAVQRPKIIPGKLLLPAGTPDVPARTLSFLKQQARIHLSERSKVHQDALQPPRRFTQITIRDQKSVWGSCSAKGVLSYNWRLVMAPWHVLDALAAHEVAHLKHGHHRESFWRTARWLCPRTDEAEAWLKRHGRNLSFYGPPRGG